MSDVIGAPPGEVQSPAAAPASNLMLRVVSAAVLAPLALVAAYVGDWPFALFWGAASIAVLSEWIALVSGPGHRLMVSACASALAVAALVMWLERPFAAAMLIGLGALAGAIFAARGRRLWSTAGMFYAGLMLLAPMLLRADTDYGFRVMIVLFAIVWTTDVLAYFGGRAIGGPKLMPSISPKKTWSGAIVGALGAVLVTIVIGRFFGPIDLAALALVALLLSVVSQAGDLLESWIKRRFGAKDAGRLIPGHGGVMDRLDGFWAAALIGGLIGLAHGGFEGAARGLLVW